MKFVRRIQNVSGEYGAMSLPKAIYDCWIGKDYTHVEMLFDEKNNTLIICPV